MTIRCVFTFHGFSFFLSFLVSVIYSKAKLASACGGIIYFLSYVPYMYVAIREEVAHDKITAFEKCIAVSIASFDSETAVRSAVLWFGGWVCSAPPISLSSHWCPPLPLVSVPSISRCTRWLVLVSSGGPSVNPQWKVMTSILDCQWWCWSSTLQCTVCLPGTSRPFIQVRHLSSKLFSASRTSSVESRFSAAGMYGLPRPWYFPLQRSYWSGSGRVETWEWPWCGGGATRLSVMEEDQACAMDQRRSGTDAQTDWSLVDCLAGTAQRQMIPMRMKKKFLHLPLLSSVFKAAVWTKTFHFHWLHIYEPISTVSMILTLVAYWVIIKSWQSVWINELA